jgi:hypothetical protein
MKKKKARLELAAAIEDVFYHGPTHEPEWCGTWHAIEADILALIQNDHVTVSWLDKLRTRPVERAESIPGGITGLLDRLTIRPNNACKCGGESCQN